MAWPLRLQFPGAVYPVMSRGIERRPIVRGDADRNRWIDWLRRTVENYDWRPRAFVLMATITYFGDRGTEPLCGHAVPQRQLHELLQPSSPQR